MTALKHKKIVLPDLDCRTPEGSVDFFSEGPLAGSWQTLYANLQRYRLRHWKDAVAEFEASPDDVYAAWVYANHHPMFYRFRAWRQADAPLAHERHLDHESGWRCVHIDPHKVDPETRRIEDDDSRNTHLEWWVELGPTLYHSDGGFGVSGHDYKLDGGADTYEEAICFAARQIHTAYGNDRRKVVKTWKDSEIPLAG